ncbi:hypothetical protein MCELHM10_01970 [Paracoccaceae bacterium]|jgi:hypothetical protein
MTFSMMTLITAFVTLGLGLALVFAPAAMLKPWGLPNPTAAAVMCRRLCAVYLGLAVMMYLVRSGDPQTGIAVGVATATGLLALMGLNELRLGNVTKGIFVAVTVEVLLTAGFLSTLGA